MWLERVRTVLALRGAGDIAILVGAWVAALALSFAMPSRQPSEPKFSSQAAVVVSLPQRPIPPAPGPAARRQPAAYPSPASVGDAGSLAKQLQSELARVGCYDGEVHGVWNKSSRAAMKAFTERVNAQLPVGKPDQILLALVRNHQGRACAAACGEGEALQGDGRCVPEAAVARVADSPEGSEHHPHKAAVAPIIAPAPVAAGRPRLPAAQLQEPRLVAPPRLVKDLPVARSVPEAARASEPPAVTPSSERDKQAARDDAPIPAAGMRGGRTRKYVGSTPYRQMKSIYRSLKRAASNALPFP